MSNPFLQHAQRLKTGFLEREHLIFVDGKWIEPSGRERNAVIDPSTGEALTTIAMGKAEDIDRVSQLRVPCR
jgi:phenylacetaldehyde dehydrogenase